MSTISKTRRLAILFISAVVSLLHPPFASACNVPVFRYALEKWRPDAYEVVVFHQSELSAEEEAQIQAIRAESIANGGLANFAVTVVDANNLVHEAIRTIWEEQKLTGGLNSNENLPWVVVQSPVRNRQNVTLWAGKLADFEAPKLLDSPARRELSQRLLAGESIVWIFLASSDAAANELAMAKLGACLKELESKIKLPEGIGEPGSEVESPLPVAIRFSLLEIRRDDLAETTFLQHLLHETPDLATADEPLVIPVYGCGRALDVLSGEELEPAIFERAAKFLCGACSCQVKEQNPGFDLLLKTDWDSIFAAGAPHLARETKHDQTPAAEYVPIPPGSTKSGSIALPDIEIGEISIHDARISFSPTWGRVAFLLFGGALMIGALLFGILIAARIKPRE